MDPSPSAILIGPGRLGASVRIALQARQSQFCDQMCVGHLFGAQLSHLRLAQLGCCGLSLPW